MLRAKSSVEPFASKLLPAYGRQFFRAYLADHELDSWHVFGLKDRSGYIHDIARTILDRHCEVSGKILADPERTSFLTDRVYHLAKLPIPCKVDVGLAVTEIRGYDFRLDLGIFPVTSEHPFVLIKLEQAFIDKHKRIIRVPESIKTVLTPLLSQNEFHKTHSYRYCLSTSSPSHLSMNVQNVSETASAVGGALLTGFSRLTSAVDSGITSFLRDFGTQVGATCPKCRANVAAPVGAQVRCGGCGNEFFMGTAGEQARNSFSAAVGVKDQEMKSGLPGTISRSPMAS